MHSRFKEIKLIVIDIDGTLVDVNGKIGPKSISLSRELKNHNIYCTLSSARSFYYSRQIAEELDIEIPIITFDGALIKSKDNIVIYKGVIKNKIISKVLRLAEENYGKMCLCDEEYLYITPKNSLIKEYTRLNAPVKEVDSYEHLNGILEILVFCEDKSSLRNIKESFSFPFSSGMSTSVMKSPRNEYYLLTIKSKQGNKLKSVKRLVKYLGLRRKNVAVIGDWHNDMPLFEYGAFNIAVQNAIPELKRRADYITKFTNNEDAVGEVLEIVHKTRI